jgi:hypothetical protein
MSIHNELEGLQGGNASERFHLSLTNYEAVITLLGYGLNFPLLASLTDSGSPGKYLAQDGNYYDVPCTPHNNQVGLQGGASNERYHLTAQQHRILTGAVGTNDASNLHTHDVLYYGKNEVDELIAAINPFETPTFVSLPDGPGAFHSNANKLVVVNSPESNLTYTTLQALITEEQIKVTDLFEFPALSADRIFRVNSSGTDIDLSPFDTILAEFIDSTASISLAIDYNKLVASLNLADNSMVVDASGLKVSPAILNHLYNHTHLVQSIVGFPPLSSGTNKFFRINASGNAVEYTNITTDMLTETSPATNLFYSDARVLALLSVEETNTIEGSINAVGDIKFNLKHDDSFYSDENGLHLSSQAFTQFIGKSLTVDASGNISLINDVDVAPPYSVYGVAENGTKGWISTQRPLKVYNEAQIKGVNPKAINFIGEHIDVQYVEDVMTVIVGSEFPSVLGSPGTFLRVTDDGVNLEWYYISINALPAPLNYLGSPGQVITVNPAGTGLLYTTPATQLYPSFKKRHTIKIVSATPSPVEADTTYIVGDTSTITVTLSTIGLSTAEKIKVIMRGVGASSGTPSGGAFLRCNSDSGNNYGYVTQARSANGNSPSSSIILHNGTQLNDVYDAEFLIYTGYNNLPGAGVIRAYKTFMGVIYNRNISYSASSYGDFYGIWRNSSDALTTITFGINASAVNYAVGTVIEFYIESVL